MNAHWFFVINPVSGKGSGLNVWQQLQPLLAKNNVLHSFAISAYHKHTLKLVAEKYEAGVRHFMGIGGDGTLNEMLNAVLGSATFKAEEACVFGLLPVGTGNDWVRGSHLKLTQNNVVEKLKAGKTLLHDVGVIETNQSTRKHFFINVAGAGLDGSVVHEIEKLNATGKKGKAVYLRGLLKALFRFKAPQCEIEVENKRIFNGKTLLMTAGKGQFFGGGMHISPQSKPANGKLDFTLVKKVSNWKTLPHLYKLFNGQIATAPFVEKQTGTFCTVQSAEALPVQADGEWVGEAKAVTFSVLPGAILILG